MTFDADKFEAEAAEADRLRDRVLVTKTPAAAAKAFAEWLRCQARLIDSNPENVYLWNPDESKERGFGRHWSVAWEEGPYDWTMVTMGSSLYCGEFGNYSDPGPFAGDNSIPRSGWHVECQNHWMINFYKD